MIRLQEILTSVLLADSHCLLGLHTLMKWMVMLEKPIRLGLQGKLRSLRNWILPTTEWAWKWILPHLNFQMRLQPWLTPWLQPREKSWNRGPTETARWWMHVVLAVKLAAICYTAIDNHMPRTGCWDVTLNKSQCCSSLQSWECSFSSHRGWKPWFPLSLHITIFLTLVCQLLKAHSHPSE